MPSPRQSLRPATPRPVSLGVSVPGRLLVVDDNPVNRLVIQRTLEALGHETVPAADGQQALELLAEQHFDAVLLDVEMPKLDGYATLQRIKADARLTHLPVIMVTGVDDVDSVVRCIELGAIDYLPKPFDAAVLRARIGSALAAKRARDVERDLLDQVDRLTSVAAAVEESTFDSADLDPVAERTDAIGALARVFRDMAEKVIAREQRLERQVAQLQRDAAAAQRAASAPALIQLSNYLAIDRRTAIATGRELPALAIGVVLNTDVSGFTAAVAARAAELGGTRGAEELLADLNTFYDRCVACIHSFGGSVVGFAGDGMLTWFDDRDGSVDAIAAALAAGLALHEVAAADTAFAALKITAAYGSARRLVVGDPDQQLLDLLWGPVVAEAEALQRRADPGTLLVGSSLSAELERRSDVRVAQISAEDTLASVIAVEAADAHTNPWPPIDRHSLSADALRPWLLPAVFDTVLGGEPGFLAELRPVSALFVGFEGLDIDGPDSGDRLDVLVRWVQAVVARHEGALVQFTASERGGYAYVCFGAPRALEDDAAAALTCALELRMPLGSIGLQPPHIGLARGPMRVGGYGGVDHTAYGAIGRETNLAARLMQTAGPGEILADASALTSGGAHLGFEPANVGSLKGVDGPLRVFRLASIDAPQVLDQLSPAQASVVKIASIFTGTFDTATLRSIIDDIGTQQHGPGHLTELLDDLCRQGVFVRRPDGFAFADDQLRATAHERLLYTQRRRLHRDALRRLETQEPAGLDQARRFRAMGEHAEHAEDAALAAGYYERAAEFAQQRGQLADALALTKAALRMETISQSSD